MSGCRSAAGISHARLFAPDACQQGIETNALRATMHENIISGPPQPWNRWRARHSRLSISPLQVTYRLLVSAQHRTLWGFFSKQELAPRGGCLLLSHSSNQLSWFLRQTTASLFLASTKLCLRIHRLQARSRLCTVQLPYRQTYDGPEQ